MSAILDWQEMFEERGVAISCDPDSDMEVLTAIRNLMEDPQRTFEIRRKGAALIEDCWNYEAQFAPVLRALASVAQP